jgi:hypothetical protein
VVVATVLREPLSWQLSFYKYVMQGHKRAVLKFARERAARNSSAMPRASAPQLLCRIGEDVARNWSRTSRDVQSATLFQRPPHWSKQEPLSIQELDLVGTTERLGSFVEALMGRVGLPERVPALPHVNRIHPDHVLGKSVRQECPHLLRMLTDPMWPNMSANVFARSARASKWDHALWKDTHELWAG